MIETILISGGISLATVVGGKYTLKYISIITKKLLEELKRKREKKILKAELLISIKKLNYEKFVNTIYKIKNYDNKYNKNLYIKSKNNLIFNDDTVKNIKKFINRFDLHNKIEDIIKIEVEKSIILLEDRLNL